MTARDKIHRAVRKALEKEGWTITHDPLSITFLSTDLAIDLGAEKLTGAEVSRIAIEIKSFVAPSAVFEMHQVVGQFLNYEQALEETGSDRTLYLAVPAGIWRSFFKTLYAQAIIRRRGIRLIVVKPKEEVIIEWIK